MNWKSVTVALLISSVLAGYVPLEKSSGPAVMYSQTERGRLCAIGDVSFSEQTLLSVRFRDREERLLALSRSDGKTLTMVFPTGSFLKLMEITVCEDRVNSQKFVPTSLLFDVV